MSLVAAIRGMLAKGFSVEQALDAAEAVEAAGASKTVRQARNARYYEARKERLKASETSESDATSESVLTASETVLIKTPLACVEDNPSTEIQDGKITTQYDVREFADPPTRAESEWLTAELFAAGFPALNDTLPNLHVTGPIMALLRPGTGPPCDFEADVLAVIRAKSKSKPPKSIRTWTFFREAILEARDRRLQENPKVTPLDEHRPHPSSGKLAAKQANLARAFAGSERTAVR